MNTIESQLAAAREKLLDLTLRNRLLNHRPSAKRTLAVVDEIPAEVYRRLVIDEKAMWFKAEPEKAPEPEPLPEAAPEPENEPENEPETGPESGAEPEAGPDTTAEAIPEPETKPETGTETEPETETETEPGTETAAAPDAATTPDAAAAPVPDADPETAPAEKTNGEDALTWTGIAEPEEAEVAERHRDRYLQTQVKGEALQKRLFYIHQQARSVLEEQGYTVLYLALGFLEWRGDEDDRTHRAPLVLVPVDLERPKVGSAFKVRWTHEEIHTNISLKAKLADENVTLPEFEMPDEMIEIDGYFERVAAAVAAHADWQVVPDIALDFFSFTKFVMFRDLDPDGWGGEQSAADNPLLRTVLDPDRAADAVEEDVGFREDEVDARLRAEDVFHVMDADPSQIAVIEDVKAGRNLVVEGPPGTGKSQTITNVIAELLAAGNSVLFVSEKMAALEVVKRRLDRVGLGAFCLELHSRKSRKREVLEELKRSLAVTAVEKGDRASDYERLEGLRGDLNGYAGVLGRRVGATGLTPFALFGLAEDARAHFAAVDRSMPRAEMPGAFDLDTAGLADLRARFETLADALTLVHPVREHPWRGCRPGSVLPADEEEILDRVDAAQAALEGLDDRAEKLSRAAAVTAPASVAAVEPAVEAARLLTRAVGATREQLVDPRWDRDLGETPALAAAVEALKAWRAHRSGVLERFRPEVLDEDVSALLAEFRPLATRFFLFRWFSGRYRYLKKKITLLYAGKPPRDAVEWVLDLERVEKARQSRDALRAVSAEAESAFGRAWRGEETDPTSLVDFAAWVRSFRAHRAAGRYLDDVLDRLDAGLDGAAVEAGGVSLIEARDAFTARRDPLAARVGLEPEVVFGASLGDVTSEQWEERLEAWRDAMGKLQAWTQFRAVRDEAESGAGAPLVAGLVVNDPPPADVSPALEGNLADTLLGRAFAGEPSLNRFVGELHERKIADFRSLDLELIGYNRRRLASRLFARRPVLSGGASPRSEAGILLGEFNRKRGHMPIRRLMSRAGSLIQRIKPCFMMSPLSIAQFLTPETARFDVVVFDEASQVRPEDALGAMLRGRRLVVMGDTRQLPPTSFFDHLIEADDDDEDAAEAAASLKDIESILHQCKRCFPVKTLRWHYRSRHESLIAVSNESFYGNQLRIYPSPFHDVETLGLRFRHLPETRYDRGGTGVNRLEARAVAEASVRHFREHPDKSLGIGAFNVRQQRAILEEIERQLRENPEVESHFTGGDEPFFVKNLETIQGDERDVIFLSIGFGVDQGGKLSRNFGPLNQDGGERRLNVLITRARERCVVFSNFRGDALPLDANAPFGLRALRAFLLFAERRVGADAAAEVSAPETSPFERAVGEALTEAGHEVRHRVGCAGFRVDVGLVDPDHPDRFRLGIECDAPKYHDATVSRDRDRLRRQVLENLGWRIVRVWSTDWYRNRDETVARLLELVGSRKHGRPALGAVKRVKAELDRAAAEAQSEAEENGDTFEPSDELEAGVPEYRVCAKLGVPVDGDLIERPTRTLARAIRNVVKVEGPVHVDAVVRRVRILWGLKRTGTRIQEALEAAMAHAEEKGWIRRDADFLWPADLREAPVRRRVDRADAQLEWVADAEIAAAMLRVLRFQYATPVEGLIRKTARLLGFPVTTAAVKSRLAGSVEGLLLSGEIRETGDQTVDLAERT